MKKRTKTEQSQYDLRERLIAYYESRKSPDAGKLQVVMAAEVPCSVGTLSAFLTRGREIKGMSAVAIEQYLNRMENQ